MVQRLVKRRQGGFNYVITMFVVAVVSVAAMHGVENMLTKAKREKEAQLMWVGRAYRDAIKSYYENSPGTLKTYPPDLQALLTDARATRIRRPLRRLYRDPITNGEEWGVVYHESGGVMGVFSLSKNAPFKVDGFEIDEVSFKNAKHYTDWRFVYQPK